MKPAPIEGVHFCAVLPLAWQEQCYSSSFETARYLAVLAEFEQNREDIPAAQTEINAKLDLALLWLARMLASDLPPPCEAAIGLEQLCWQSQAPVAVGEQGFVVLNLSQSLPFRLSLPAQIVACAENTGCWQITAHLQISDEGSRDWWERTVFRRHRRVIQIERGERE